MLKRFVASLLIITQIYSNLFQGMVHAATLVDESHYHRHLLEKPDDRGDDESIPPTASSSVEDAHISSFTHLYSEINQRGELQFALGDGSFKAPRVFTIPTLERQTDILEYGGVTVKAQSTSFRFQGLRVSINRAGVMMVEGYQAKHKPIFLASNRPIILSNIEASALSIFSPGIVTTGISTFGYLMFEGQHTAEGDALFVNAGKLTAKELFLKNLTSTNIGGIAASRFEVNGRLASTGSISSVELFLEESAFLKLTETSRADIKTLFLSQASHLENHGTTHTALIGVLDGLGGSLTNHGTLAVGEVAADSAFQAITNRHFLDVALGTIQTQQFENFGTFISSQSDLQVVDGQNLGALKTKGLLVKAEFTNTATGAMDTPLVFGSGHLRNLGKIETEETLGLSIKRFSNSGLVKAQSVIGWLPNVSSTSLSGLEQLDNGEDGVIEASVGISFTESTQVNNFGKFQTEDMALYSDKTLQKGDLIARTLNLIGGTFLNQGEIEVDHLTAENGLININQASLVTSESTDFGAGGLTNAARATAKLKGLVLSGDTRVINHGKLLKIDGVDTALGILQINNTGGATAIIDAGNALPSSSALISVPDVAIGTESGRAGTSRRVPNYDEEFIALINIIDARKLGSKYKRQALGIPETRTVDSDFAALINMIDIRKLGTKYKYQALGHENELTVDPEFRTLVQARSTGGKYKSEVLGQDSIQGDPEFYTLSQAREAGARYKAQAKLALETKRDQLQQQRSQLPPITPYDPIFKDMNGLVVKQLASRYKRQVLGIPENGQIDQQFSSMYGVVLKQAASKYKFYKENPQSYVVDQELQKVQKELAETRWNFGLTLQERQLREAQLEADREKLAPEIFKVRLSVTNQATGNLTLRSGHFDMTGDQALVNDGMLTQEAAQLHLFDPTTWSQPRSFNAGTWRVQGTLTLLGNAAKDVGKLEVEYGLDVHTAEFGSGVLRGQIETTDFSASSGIELFGSLVTHRSTQLQGLIITADAVADLKGLKLTGGEISNLGKLRVIGVDPASGVIKLTNGGSATIDAGHALPRSSAVIYAEGVAIDPEFDDFTMSMMQRIATHYKSLVKPIDGKTDSEFAEFTMPMMQRAATAYKQKAITHFRTITLQDLEEQVRTASRQELSAEALLEKTDQLRIVTERYQVLDTHFKPERDLIDMGMGGVVTSLMRPGLILEPIRAEHLRKKEELRQLTDEKHALEQELAANSRTVEQRQKVQAQVAAYQKLAPEIFKVRLSVTNQATGQLTLKSGKFEFAGDTALVNDGTLIQHSADTLWLTSAPREFNRGTWRVSGSLGLLGYSGSNLGNLQVEETLYLECVNQDAITTLDGFSKVMARTVKLKAPSIENSLTTPERKPKQYPWFLDLQITGGIQNAFDISVPGLKLMCKSLKTTGNIFVHPGMLELAVEGDVDVKAVIYGRAGINLHSKKLDIQARLNIPGAAVPNILYKRAELGLYSEGPVVLDIDELIGNYYGDIQGTSLAITAPQLINTAGLICATDSSLSSILNIKNIKNTRDDYTSRPEGFSHYNYPYHDYCYETGGVYYREWCSAPAGCCPRGGCSDGKCLAVPVYTSTGYYEASDEGVIVSEGDLTLNYNTLEMIVSSITSRGNLTLVSSGHSLDYPNLAAGAELLALPGATTMTKRCGHVNRIVAKKGLVADVGRADMAASMYGQNVTIRAAVLTMQSLGFAPQQQAQVFDLFTQAESSTNAYRRSEDGSIDTLAPYSEQLPPDSIVVLGRDAQAQMERSDRINLRMYKRAIKQQIQRLFFSYGRGIDGLGVSLSDFFKLNSAFVRSHPDTRSQMHSIRFGDQTHEVELLLNPTLTQQAVLERQDRVLHLQIDHALDTFEENLNALQSEDLVSDALARARQRSKMLQGSIKLAIQPESQSDRCVRAADTASLVSETDASIATSVKALNIQIIANGTTTVSSDVIHYQYGEYGQNYWQVLDRTSIEAVKTLLIEGKNIHFKAINTHSGEETRFISRGNTVDASVALASQRFSDIEDGWRRDKWVHQAVSTHSSGGSITSLALGEQHLFAPTIDCKKLVIEGLEGVSIYEVHDTHEHESHTSKSGGGLFGGTTETHTSSQSARSKGARLTASDSVEILSGGDINLRNVSLFTPHTSLESLEGVVRIFLGTNYESYSSITSSEDMFWQSVEATQSRHSTFTTPTVTGEVVINSQRDAIVQKIYQQSLSYASRIKIEGGGRIVFENVHEHHEHFHVEQSGPTAAFAAVVAIGVSIATAGTGAGPALASSAVSAVGATGVTAAVISGMTVGAFTAVCNQAAMALLYSKGDIGKAAKILASSQSLRQIGVSIASGGLVGNGGGDFLLGDFGNRVLQGTVTAGLRSAILGEDFGKGFVHAVGQAGIGVLAAGVAEKIGDAHTPTQLSGAEVTGDFTHIASHVGLGVVGGGLTSVLIGSDVGRGARSGGVGALVGILVTKGLKSDTDTEGQRLRITRMADFTAAVVAFGTGLDPSLAYQTSQNASVHNELKHMDTLKALGIVGEDEEVYEDDRDEQDQERGRSRERDKSSNPLTRTRSLSPPLKTLGQTYVAEPVRKFVAGIVPDAVKDAAHQAGEWVGKKAEKSATQWQRFKDDPSLDTWSTKHSMRHLAFEALDLAAAGYERAKSSIRKDLRFIGVSADVAQDIVSAGDTGLAVFGATKVATSLVTSTARGATKVVQASQSAVESGSRLTGKLGEMVRTSAPKVRGYVRDQFNYREFFEAERLRLEAGKKPLRFGQYAEAEDTLGLKRLSKEQPWFVRPGQEWKAQVFGKAQVTGGSDVIAGKAHAIQAYRRAITLAKQDSSSTFFMNRGVRKATGHPIAAPNSRPDVTIRRGDGVIDQIEVPSRTDNPRVLLERMKATQKRLPQEMQGGKTDVFGFTKEIP